jgi:hypothetical protein
VTDATPLTATGLRELLARADRVAAGALGRARALLAPCFDKSRRTSRPMLTKQRLELAHRTWVNGLPSFGSIAIEEGIIDRAFLSLAERRAGPASWDAANPSRDDADPAIGLYRGWLLAKHDHFAAGVRCEGLFSLAAVDAWLAAHDPEPVPTYEDPRSWSNPPIVAALAEDPGWIGEHVEGVRMIHGWTECPASVAAL